MTHPPAPPSPKQPQHAEDDSAQRTPPHPPHANVPDENGEPPSVKRGDDPLWSEPPVENE